MTAKNDPQTSPQTVSDHTMTTKTPTPRLPPPEKPEAIRTRFKVIAAFWAVIIFLGFPIWWKTTSIYRASLPVPEMIDWADGKVISPSTAHNLANQHTNTRLVVLSSPSRSASRPPPCPTSTLRISSALRSTRSTTSMSSPRTICD